MSAEVAGAIITQIIKFGIGAVAFGVWQNSVPAGIFMLILLMSVDTVGMRK